MSVWLALPSVSNIERYMPRRGMSSRKTYVHTLTQAQLLWTDPQDTPGRGPSKRVRGRAVFCYTLSQRGSGGWPCLRTRRYEAVVRPERCHRHHPQPRSAGEYVASFCAASVGAQCILDGYAIEHDGLCTTVSLHLLLYRVSTHPCSRSFLRPTTLIKWGTKEHMYVVQCD